MDYKIAKTAIVYGKVRIGKGSVIQDNVILGSSDDGELVIGENAIVRSGSIIYSKVRIGANFKSGHNILVRENTEIGDSVLVGTNSVVEGDCRIGNSVSIQTGVYVTRYSVVEDKAFLGPFCVTTNDKYMRYGAELKGPIIKEGARIGANATILPGIVIGRNAVVGSGAVVTKDVSDGEVVAGNPARPMRRKSD
ncbi:MAG: N-acetyltransferase [Chloroflexi bacterium]|nr:N-acetyltransferase [Chloroflexota bacterium]